MACKQVVFVIVEGTSDETALGVLLHRLYSDRAVYIHIERGDITTRSGSSPSNIRAKVGTIITQYAKARHFKQSDFKEIIHLMDMDGAYVPNECIIEAQGASPPFYSLTDICTDDKNKIAGRNKQKRLNMDVLCACRKIWDTPYRAFYMSCNLDHVLYDKQNSTTAEKEADAMSFARQYRENPEAFLRFISRSDFSVMNGYGQSWDFIKQGLHSLERHSNFGLCFAQDSPD